MWRLWSAHPRASASVRQYVVRVAVLAAALFGVVASSAHAEVVWAKAGEIWAMHDDGSGARRLIAPADVPGGMNRLRSPMAAPSGARLVFTAETDVNRFTRTGLCGLFPYQYSCFTTHFGYNAAGTYRWTAGVSTRESAAPAYCLDCTSTSNDPSMREDGTIVSYVQLCKGFLSEANYQCTGGVQSTSGESFGACADVSGVAARPGSTEVAYTGCLSSGQEALVVTGPSRVGERVVACDDAEQRDPAWSPVGDRVIVSEGGVEPGLWAYAPSNSGCFAGDLRRVLAAPAGTTFNDPAYLGADRVMFEAGGELWTVPAGCVACAFPGAATQLTTGANNSDPAWTSDALVTVAAPNAGMVTPPAGVAPPGAVPTPDRSAPSLILRNVQRTQRVGARKRIVLHLVLSETGTITASGAVRSPGKDPAITSVTARVAAGVRATLTLKLGRKAMSALAKAWRARTTPKARIEFVVADAAGNHARSGITVILRR
jgi:hypothetical protein